MGYPWPNWTEEEWRDHIFHDEDDDEKCGCLVTEKWDEADHPRDENGRFTDGGGGTAGGGESSGGASDGGPPVPVHSIEEAIELLGEGQGVMFERPKQVVTMLHKLRKIVKEAKKAGEKAKVYDLCKVYVAGTNLFCAKNMQIPRSAMPQLKGVPVHGSPAASMEADKRGKVDLTHDFLEHLHDQGIKIERVKIKAGLLRPSQNQIDGAKVAKILHQYEEEGIPDRAFLVSTDHYIVDGHHHWAAQVALQMEKHKTVKTRTFRIGEKILPLLKRTKEYTRRMGIGPRAIGERWVDIVECSIIIKQVGDSPQGDHNGQDT